MDDQLDIKLIRMRDTIQEHEDFANTTLDIAPCLRCHGKGYTVRMMTHPRDALIKATEVCTCINKNLPIPEIKDGKLNFVLG